MIVYYSISPRCLLLRFIQHGGRELQNLCDKEVYKSRMVFHYEEEIPFGISNPYSLRHTVFKKFCGLIGVTPVYTIAAIISIFGSNFFEMIRKGIEI